MYNHKFPFKIIYGRMVEYDRERFAQVVRGLKDGEYEMVLRKKIKWDTNQMRKYFHKVVLDFVVEQFKQTGNIYSRDEIKQFLKERFGKRKMVTENWNIPCSTADYDFATYTKFINDINDWCIECFQCELPPAEQVD